MVKLTYCIRRRADLSEEEFYTYWLQQHAALVTRHARALGARRYVQSHTVAPDVNRMLQTSRGSLDAFDGITEVWWDSRAAFDAALASPEGRAAGRALLSTCATKTAGIGSNTIFSTQPATPSINSQSTAITKTSRTICAARRDLPATGSFI